MDSLQKKCCFCLAKIGLLFSPMLVKSETHGTLVNIMATYLLSEANRIARMKLIPPGINKSCENGLDWKAKSGRNWNCEKKGFSRKQLKTCISKSWTFGTPTLRPEGCFHQGNVQFWCLQQCPLQRLSETDAVYDFSQNNKTRGKTLLDERLEYHVANNFSLHDNGLSPKLSRSQYSCNKMTDKTPVSLCWSEIFSWLAQSNVFMELSKYLTEWFRLQTPTIQRKSSPFQPLPTGRTDPSVTDIPSPILQNKTMVETDHQQSCLIQLVCLLQDWREDLYTMPCFFVQLGNINVQHGDREEGAVPNGLRDGWTTAKAKCPCENVNVRN